ncbi:hypothetical protein XENOCAPTIV_011656, partial [Xenoophorus captivus]
KISYISLLSFKIFVFCQLISSPSTFPQVAKDVSIRIHSQLDSVEKKRSRLEQENEELRVRLQDLEVAKQVLQQELDKVRLKSFSWSRSITAFLLYTKNTLPFLLALPIHLVHVL